MQSLPVSLAVLRLLPHACLLRNARLQAAPADKRGGQAKNGAEDDARVASVRAFNVAALQAKEFAEQLGSKEMAAWLRGVCDEGTTWAEDLWKARVAEAAGRFESAAQLAKAAALDFHALDNHDPQVLLLALGAGSSL